MSMLDRTGSKTQFLASANASFAKHNREVLRTKLGSVHGVSLAGIIQAAERAAAGALGEFRRLLGRR